MPADRDGIRGPIVCIQGVLMHDTDPLHHTHVRADRLMVGVPWALAVLSFALAPSYQTWGLAFAIAIPAAGIPSLMAYAFPGFARDAFDGRDGPDDFLRAQYSPGVWHDRAALRRLCAAGVPALLSGLATDRPRRRRRCTSSSVIQLLP
jgi:hypothetical protein